MGRQALFAAVCWLTLSHTFGEQRTLSSAIQDNESAESAPRLYRNVPAGVYASAAPYGAYSFHLPTWAVAPNPAASQVIPVREHYVNHLTDSYGNKFVGAPQLATYKIAYPQQFVPLQKKLPEHLAQPLVAASANFQFQQSNGQFFGAPYRVPALQHPAPTPLHSFPSFGQLYGDKVNNFAPNQVSQAFGSPNTQQQSTNNKAVFTNSQRPEQFGNFNNEAKSSHQKEPQIVIGSPKTKGIQAVPVPAPPETRGENKFQRIQEVPHSSHSEPKYQRIQEAPHPQRGEVKFQRIQETPNNHRNEIKSQQQASHTSHDGERYQRVQELPHYESKFQVIEEQPYYEFQRIKEHHAPNGEVKFQRVQDARPTHQTQHTYERSNEKPQQTRFSENSHNKAKLQAAPAKQTVTYINDVNGQKTIVELETKPIPLLDLTLLEPLTFDNPLVPQVQHFLPRISQATYQKLPQAIPSGKKYEKEFVVQKTTSYDSAEIHDKPQKDASKKKHKYPKKTDTPKKTTVTYHETLDEAPEIVYEINSSKSPNYKETVKEKAISYNKQTQSEPVHVSYGSKSENEPVTYSYSRTSKDPAQIKSVQYGNDPSHLIYTFNPEEQAHEEKSHNSAPHHNDAEIEHVSSHESHDDVPAYHQHQHTEQYKEDPQSPEEHHQPSHKEKENYHHENGNHHKEDSNHHKESVHYHKGNGNHHKDNGHYHKENDNHHRGNGNHHKDNGNYHKENDNHHRENDSHHKNDGHYHKENDHHRDNGNHHKDDGQYHKENANYHRENGNHHHENDNHHKEEEKQQNVVHDNPPKYHSEPVQFTSENINFQPILKEYENNIRLLTVPSASIKVDPHQHVQPSKSTPQPHVNHHEEHSQPQHPPSPAPQEHHSSPESQRHDYQSSPHSESYNGPAQHIHEKSKRIIIHEEAPDEMHMLREQMREEVIKREENSEEDFEKAYHNAALGFPAYNQKPTDAEKDIFDPESYTAPRDEYDFESVPFQQYQEEGDRFPKETRSRYKDARDKMKQNYYSDYSVSKPESLLDRYQNKLGYYKLFKQQKPDYLIDDEEEDKKQNQKSAKYTAAPAYDYSSSKDKGKSYYGHPAPKQQLYEYDYSKGAPRDNSAFASRPYQRFQSRSSFVEPQFQYGFEPLAIPKLLDSELAAMASNDSPESEKPGMRKKVYKENWYIKKTSTSAGAPAS